MPCVGVSTASAAATATSSSTGGSLMPTALPRSSARPSAIANVDARRPPLLRVRRERLREHGVDRLRDAGAQLRRRRQRIVELALHDLRRRARAERRPAGQRAVHRGGEAVDVDRRGRPPARGTTRARRSPACRRRRACRRALTATPTSTSTARSRSRSSRMLAGLTSRWIRPSACIASSASPISSAICAIASDREPLAALERRAQDLGERLALDELHHEVDVALRARRARRPGRGSCGGARRGCRPRRGTERRGRGRSRGPSAAP